MGKKRGHWQAFAIAEDGSALRVIGSGKPVRNRADANAERKVRLASTRKREQDEARSWQRELREMVRIPARG